jgi:hypothetical protein
MSTRVVRSSSGRGERSRTLSLSGPDRPPKESFKERGVALEDGAGVFVEDRALAFFLDLGTSVQPSEGDGAGEGFGRGMGRGPDPVATASRYEGRLEGAGDTGGADVIEGALRAATSFRRRSTVARRASTSARSSEISSASSSCVRGRLGGGVEDG